MGESPPERAARYRRMAAQTRTLALAADQPTVQAAYLVLAEKWDRRAEEEFPASRRHQPRGQVADPKA